MTSSILQLMRALTLTICATCCCLCSSAFAQLENESVTRDLDLKRLAPLEKGPPFVLAPTAFKERYRYEVAGYLRLLPLGPHIRRCVESQRAISGEFHTRLDFLIEPSGKLKSFTERHGLDQLHACLLPHALTLSFPKFSGEPSFTLQVIVASPGVQLGRRVAAKPVAVYPVGTDEERRAYLTAVSWVYTPWSMGIDRCAEWVDQTMGFGYTVGLEAEITPAGRPASARLKIEGKRASKAIDLLARCVGPFVKALDVPRHAGPRPVLYRKGTRTAGWGIR
jgi:hypothetical protein